MTPSEFFQAHHSNPAWVSNMECDIAEAAQNVTLAILSGNPEVGRREMDGARLALSVFRTLHLKQAPEKPMVLNSGLRHDLESVQRGRPNAPGTKKADESKPK